MKTKLVFALAFVSIISFQAHAMEKKNLKHSSVKVIKFIGGGVLIIVPKGCEFNPGRIKNIVRAEKFIMETGLTVCLGKKAKL